MSQIRDHRTRALSYGGHEFVTIVRKGLNSEIVDFPKPNSWETPAIDIPWYIILPFCHFAAIPPKKKKRKNRVDNPISIAMSLRHSVKFDAYH